jgi:hypothetical protein
MFDVPHEGTQAGPVVMLETARYRIAALKTSDERQDSSDRRHDQESRDSKLKNPPPSGCAARSQVGERHLFVGQQRANVPRNATQFKGWSRPRPETQPAVDRANPKIGKRPNNRSKTYVGATAVQPNSSSSGQKHTPVRVGPTMKTGGAHSTLPPGLPHGRAFRDLAIAAHGISRSFTATTFAFDPGHVFNLEICAVDWTEGRGA